MSTAEIKVLKFAEGTPVAMPDPDYPVSELLQKLRTIETIDSTTTGTNATTEDAVSSILKVTNATLDQVAGIPGHSTGKFLVLINDTGSEIEIEHDNAPTGADGILTPNGEPIELPNQTGLFLVRSTSLDRWVVSGGSGGGAGGIALWETAKAYDVDDVVIESNKIYICLNSHTSGTFATDLANGDWQSLSVGDVNTFGSKASPVQVDVTGITFSSTFYDNTIYIEGDGGAIDVTTNPQITAPTLVGQKLRIVGCHAVNTVQLDDGAGLSLRGPWLSDLGNVLNLYADTDLLWCEDNRSL